MVQDPDFGLAKAGKIAILAGLTKALTAFAVLQNVTHKRMMKQIPMTVLWEGVVTDEKEDEDYHKLIKFKQNHPDHNLPQPSDHNQILLELSNYLQSDQKPKAIGSPADQTSFSKIPRASLHNAYKVTTKTTYLTTQTTTISPLEDPTFKKKIIVRTNQEENQSYLALWDKKQPAKFFLSALSEKTRKRKVERQEHSDFNHQRRFSSPDDSLNNYEDDTPFLLEKGKKYCHSTSDLPHTRQRHASISSVSSCVISTENNKRTIKKKRSSSISSCSSDGAIQFNSSFTMTSTLQNTSSYHHEDDQQNSHNHIVNNIAHFMRYASAAYGESFMRILGIGDIPTDLPSTRHHHPNHHAFAHHTGNSVEDILLSSYTDRSLLHLHNPSIHALVHYVTVDHAAKAIVLTCRGTLGLSDILTDLSFDYTEFTLPQNNNNQTFKAHSGMLDAAQLLAKEKGKVYQKIRQGLDMYPDYGLVLCGHSLGAGVASLLCVLWSKQMMSGKQPFFVTSSQSGLPPGRTIHCYAYGPPGVMSLDLSHYCEGLVTSVVHGYDIVSSLSLGLLKDFKNIATSLHAESNAADEIISRVVGRLQQQKAKKQEDDDEDDQWFWAMIKTMRADMTAEKMYPPSTVYIIETIPHTKQQHKVVLCRCDDVEARFSEIVFTRTMFMDHSPLMYEKAIRKLCRGIASC